MELPLSEAIIKQYVVCGDNVHCLWGNWAYCLFSIC